MIMSTHRRGGAVLYPGLLLLMIILAVPTDAQVQIDPADPDVNRKQPYLQKDLEGMPPDAVTCSVTCETNPSCSGTNVPCPACDEIGLSTCADVTLKSYNPGMAQIQWAVSRSDPCVQQQANDAGQVLCYRTQSCGEGLFISFTMCSHGAACVGTFPLPMICQQCVALGTPNDFFVANETCSYNKCCCPDPDDTECFPSPEP